MLNHGNKNILPLKKSELKHMPWSSAFFQKICVSALFIESLFLGDHRFDDIRLIPKATKQ